MNVTVAPIPTEVRVFPSYELRKLLGRKIDRFAVQARDLVVAAKLGPEVHFLPFVRDGVPYALSSRVDRAKGTLDVEIGSLEGCGCLRIRPISSREFRRAEDSRRERPRQERPSFEDRS